MIIGLLISEKIEGFTLAVLPLAAAGFLYIAVADLFPELHKETKMSKSLIQLVSFVVGVALMYFLTFLE